MREVATPKRLPEMMSSRRADLDALLDATVLGHIAYVGGDGLPLVVPTAVVRHGDEIIVHGSTGSGWMRSLAGGVAVAISITSIDGVVVARSAFASSLAYRSAVIFGSFTVVPDAAKEQVLLGLTERLIPGRVTEVRPTNRRELAATLVLSMPIDTWSLRISTDWPDDEPRDVAGPAWAGIVTLGSRPGLAAAAPDLPAATAIPSSVRRMVAGDSRL